MVCCLRSIDHSEFPSKKADVKDETANSTLLRVAITDATKRAEVWKAGLDVELIFVSESVTVNLKNAQQVQIALFVAVITAFLVPALQSINDPTEQTNALLTTLTTVIVHVAALNGAQIPQMT